MTSSGTADITFNGNGQQSGYPGLATPVVSGNTDSDSVVAAQPLPDGHIFAIGDAGPATAADAMNNVALLRLNDDSSYDTSFGDATHPGWASIHIGAPGSFGTVASALTFDSSGRAFIAISCSGIIRVIPDRLFSDGNESAPSLPSCPP